MSNQQSYIESRLFILKKRFDNRLKVVADYLSASNITNVVVGFSGGADSTLVLLMLSLIKKNYLPELIIHAHTIEFKNKKDTFNIKDVNFVINQNKLNNINFTTSLINDEFSLFLPDQTAHQYLYAHRYTILFAFAQLHSGITIGTTNSDELSYVGWFGKNSDMVVDLQIIADFHKFEIMALLNGYEIIINDVPKGDLLDGRTDVECFGVDYDTLAYYAYCKCHNIAITAIPNIEKLHQQNYHKYLGQTFNPYFIVDKPYFLLYRN